MKVIKCDICGADAFNNKEIQKGKIIWVKRNRMIFIDLCPNCYKYGDTFYVM